MSVLWSELIPPGGGAGSWGPLPCPHPTPAAQSLVSASKDGAFDTLSFLCLGIQMFVELSLGISSGEGLAFCGACLVVLCAATEKPSPAHLQGLLESGWWVSKLGGGGCPRPEMRVRAPTFVRLLWGFSLTPSPGPAPSRPHTCGSRSDWFSAVSALTPGAAQPCRPGVRRSVRPGRRPVHPSGTPTAQRPLRAGKSERGDISGHVTLPGWRGRAQVGPQQEARGARLLQHVRQQKGLVGAVQVSPAGGWGHGPGGRLSLGLASFPTGTLVAEEEGAELEPSWATLRCRCCSAPPRLPFLPFGTEATDGVLREGWPLAWRAPGR